MKIAMKNPLFSIITVCKNNLQGLQATGDSIRSQSGRTFEWLVIDGESDDGSPAFLSELKLSYLRFWIEADESHFDAMNKGIERSQGDYLLFLNAGDLFHDPDVLARVVEKVGDGDWLIGDAIDQIEENKRIYKKARPLRYILHSLPSSHQAIFFRRIAIGDVRYRPNKFPISGDYAFAAEIYQAGHRTTTYLGFPICIFLLGGISTQNRRGLLRDARTVQKEILGLKLPFRTASYVYRYASMFLLDNYKNLYKLLRTAADRFLKT